MTQVVLNIGSADTGGDAIWEENITEIPVMTLYATLGRLREMPSEKTAVFSYAEVGERATYG